MAKSAKDYLMIFAYVLLLAAVVPTLAQYDRPTWALVPIWLVLVGYSASILKAATNDTSRKERYGNVVMIAWLTYFTMAIMWPLPMHWYEALVVLSFLPSTGLVSNGLLMAYYMFSAVSYLDKAEALQFSARAILSAVAAVATAHEMVTAPTTPT